MGLELKMLKPVGYCITAGGAGGADDVTTTGSTVGGCEDGGPAFIVMAPLVFGTIRAVGAEEVPAGAIIMTC